MDFERHNPVSWYPGHMRVAERQLKERLSMVDLIVEVVDARCPITSRNTNFNSILRDKTRLVLMNKQDLADPDTTQAWIQHFRQSGVGALGIHHHQRNTVGRLIQALQRTDAAARKRRGATRPRLRALRCMVIGVPNVGKSSLINLSLGKKRAVTGPRPGVTRHQQWVALSDDVEMLDTPGVMMPRVGSTRSGLKLGLIAALKDELIGHQLLVEFLLHIWESREIAPYFRHYGLQRMPNNHVDLLELVAMSHGSLRPGGEPDIDQAAQRILQDFRSNKFGPLSLETPEDFAEVEEDPDADNDDDDASSDD